MLNIGARKNKKSQEPVHLYERVTADDPASHDPASHDPAASASGG